MSYKVELDKSATKFLDNLLLSSPKHGLKIRYFLKEKLPNAENPRAMSNARKIKGSENLWRWKMGDYRIIGEIKDGEFKIIEILKIGHRKDVYE